MGAVQVADLGSGAFAHVEWAVWRQPSGAERNVAVKRLKPHLITSDSELTDFVNEGQCLRQLRHPCAHPPPPPPWPPPKPEELRAVVLGADTAAGAAEISLAAVPVAQHKDNCNVDRPIENLALIPIVGP